MKVKGVRRFSLQLCLLWSTSSLERSVRVIGLMKEIKRQCARVCLGTLSHTHAHTDTHAHGQITLYLFMHRSTYKERGVDVIARTAYMLKHGTE